MKYNPEIHHRKSIRLPFYDYSMPNYYFITICTKNKECLLGNIINNEIHLNKIGRIVKNFWLEISKHYPNVILDEWVIMPNHIHGIIFAEFRPLVGAIHELPLQQPRNIRRKMLLPKIIGYFKMNSAKIINRYLQTSGVSFWQCNYYEHIIRHEKELNQIRYYIGNNPYNWLKDRNNPKNSINYES